MCGIGGYVLLDKRKSLDKNQKIDSISLLLNLQVRGDNAWGIYLEKKKNVNSHLYCGVEDKTMPGELYKAAGSVKEFFAKNSKIYLDETHTILMHTRQTTQGNAQDNENNHPFHTKNFILAHNGCLSNDYQVKTNHKFSTSIATDSYIILALIQEFFDSGKSVAESIALMSSEIAGSMACWLYHKDTGELYLFRNSNPLSFIMNKEEGVFIFASTEDIISKSLGKEHDVISLPADKIFKLDGNSLKEVGELKECVTTTTRTKNHCGYSDDDNTVDNLNGINDSLIYLYNLFEKYEKNPTEVSTVVSILDNVIVLLVEPEDLSSLIDKVGFLEFRDKEKVYNNKYYMYHIPDFSKANTLVSKLKHSIESPSDDDDDDESTTSIMTQAKTSEVEFQQALESLAELLNCNYSYNDKEYIFKFEDAKTIKPSYKKMFSKIGFQVRKDNTIVVRNEEYHKKQITKILKKINLLGGDSSE